MTNAQHPVTYGTVFAVALVLTSYNEAQAATFIVDSSASSLTLNVIQDEATLSGTWSGTGYLFLGASAPSYGENGTYTVQLEKQFTTSTSALQGEVEVNKNSNSLEFTASVIHTTSPDSLAGNLSPIDRIGALTTTGSGLIQQQLDYPLSLPVCVGGVCPSGLDQAIYDNFGETFNYGYLYGLPLNGQAPVGQYTVSPGSQNVNLSGLASGGGGTNKVVDLLAPSPGDPNTTLFDTTSIKSGYLPSGGVFFTDFNAANVSYGMPGNPGYAPYGFSMANALFNAGSVVPKDWLGTYTSGVDEDVITLTFGYEYVLTSPILEFYDSKTCAKSAGFTTCWFQEYDVSSPMGTISTKFQLSGTVVLRGDGTLAPPAPVPLPAGLPLLASALGGLGFAGWRRKRLAA